MHSYARPAVVALVVLVCGLGAASAEDDGSTLESRLYRVGALTAGNADFIPHAFPLVSPDMVSDEEEPMFGAEAEEPRFPLGDVDMLVELVQSTVSPAFWRDVEGARVASIEGPQLLFVTATPAVHAELARLLTALEKQALRSVVVAVKAVRGDAIAGAGGLVLDDRTGAKLLLGDAAGPGVHFTAMSGQRALVFDGKEVAYFQDGDVEVSKTARIVDPIIGVVSLGMSVAVRAMPAAGGRSVRLDVAATLAEMSRHRTQTDHEGFRYDLPEILSTVVRTAVTVPSGTWALLDGNAVSGAGSGWSFLVWAKPATRTTGGTAKSLLLPRFAVPPADAETTVELVDVDDILAAAKSRASPLHADLVPSNFTPPEPPELPEGLPLLSGDALVQILWDTVGAPSWDREGTALELWNGRWLLARNTPEVLRALVEQVDRLRSFLVGTVATTVELVDVPADLARNLVASERSIVLSEAGRKMLDEGLRTGRAHRLEGARVTSSPGVRNNVATGRWSSYLQDYEVEIAESSNIPNPVIQTFFAGIVLDVNANPTQDLDSVHLELRVDRTKLVEPMRILETPHGGLELPTLELLRVRSGFAMPFGSTAVVAAGGSGDRRTLVLLTPVWVGAKPSGGETTVLRFSVEVDEAKREGRLPKDADAAEVLRDTQRVLVDRAERMGVEVVGADADFVDNEVQLMVRVESPQEVGNLAEALTARDELLFRVEVLPRERYVTDAFHEPLEREAWPWAGTAKEFWAFLEAEVERWQEAKAEKRAYAPSNPRYRVVPKHGTDADMLRHFALVEEPEDPTFRFGADMLEEAHVSRGPNGQPVVLFSVKEAQRDALAKFTQANVGLPLAIVLDGTYRTAPVIQSQLRDSVQITLGAGPYQEVRQEAKRLAAVLGSDTLKARVLLLTVER